METPDNQEILKIQRLVWLKAAIIASADKSDLASWFRNRADIPHIVTPEEVEGQ